MSLIRTDIMNAVKTRMQSIRTSAGYYTNLGSKVYEWRLTSFEDGDLPGINIADPEQTTINELTQGNYNKHDHILSVSIQVVYSSSSTPALVRKMIADVKKAISTDLTWCGLAYNTTATDEPETMDLEQKEGIYGSAFIKINIYYRTTAWLES